MGNSIQGEVPTNQLFTQLIPI